MYRKEMAVYQQQLAVQQGRPPPPVFADPFEELERRIKAEKEDRERSEGTSGGSE